MNLDKYKDSTLNKIYEFFSSIKNNELYGNNLNARSASFIDKLYKGNKKHSFMHSVLFNKIPDHSTGIKVNLKDEEFYTLDLDFNNDKIIMDCGNNLDVIIKFLE